MSEAPPAVDWVKYKATIAYVALVRRGPLSSILCGGRASVFVVRFPPAWLGTTTCAWLVRLPFFCPIASGGAMHRTACLFCARIVVISPACRGFFLRVVPRPVGLKRSAPPCPHRAAPRASSVRLRRPTAHSSSPGQPTQSPTRSQNSAQRWYAVCLAVLSCYGLLLPPIHSWE